MSSTMNVMDCFSISVPLHVKDSKANNERLSFYVLFLTGVNACASSYFHALLLCRMSDAFGFWFTDLGMSLNE